MNPTAMVHPNEPLLRNRLTSNGEFIWCTGDPDNLSQEAYRDLAMAVCEAHNGKSASLSRDSEDGRAQAGLCSWVSTAGSEKQRVPDASVILPRLLPPKLSHLWRPVGSWEKLLATA